MATCYQGNRFELLPCFVALQLLIPCLLPTSDPFGVPAGGGKSDVVAYTLPAEAGEEELKREEGHYAFPLAELTAAGAYSAVAEYVEARPELAAGLSKKDATLRSASVQFQVLPGQPVALRWVGGRWEWHCTLCGWCAGMGRRTDCSALTAMFALPSLPCVLQPGGGLRA